MNSIVYIYICNNFRLIIKFNKKLTTVRGLIVDEMFSSQKTI